MTVKGTALVAIAVVVVAAWTPCCLADDAGWADELEALLAAGSAEEREDLIGRVIEAEPPWHEVVEVIREWSPADAFVSGDAELRTTVCVDGVERPWVLVPPSDHDPSTPTPLLVVLHGGVGRATLIEDPLEYAAESHFVGLARDRGWFALLPFGQIDATWWDEVGIANIENLVREVKREFHIDDDRVYMAGFSDGASAGFFFAMTMPTDYAAIVSLNGHIGVGSLDGDQPTFARNMAAVPVYATTTFEDGLYASEKMRGTIEMAQAAGADILYRELAGEHDMDPFAESEVPLIGDFLERHPRDPFPPSIEWEATGELFGRCRWLSIDAYAPERTARWHRDRNAVLVDDRITFGFHPDWEASEGGDGVLVDGLSDGDYPAVRMGLAAGDLIVRGGRPADGETGSAWTEIRSLDDLDAFKSTLARGDGFMLEVERDGETLTLDGELDPVGYYNVFKRERPSAAVRASVSGNRVSVSPSALGAFSVYVYPELFNMDEPVIVTVGERVLHDAVVEPDVEYTLRDFLERRDRAMLCAARLSFEL